jgi:hypothetical protein
MVDRGPPRVSARSPMGTPPRPARSSSRRSRVGSPRRRNSRAASGRDGRGGRVRGTAGASRGGTRSLPRPGGPVHDKAPRHQGVGAAGPAWSTGGGWHSADRGQSATGRLPRQPEGPRPAVGPGSDSRRGGFSHGRPPGQRKTPRRREGNAGSVLARAGGTPAGRGRCGSRPPACQRQSPTAQRACAARPAWRTGAGGLSAGPGLVCQPAVVASRKRPRPVPGRGPARTRTRGPGLTPRRPAAAGRPRAAS